MPEPTRDADQMPEPVRPDPSLIREFDDRSTLWLLEDPENLRGLLQILEPSLAERLDFGRAQRINRSFVPADLQKEESDLIYTVPFGEGSGREVWLYVLLEHQSQPDPLMALRLFLYMGQLWDTQRREWQDRRRSARTLRLRPIVPVVYYSGARRWAAPLSLKRMMNLPAELERFVPEWETLFLNLRQTPPETLTQFASAIGWALRVLQAEQAPAAELERVLAEAIGGLEGLSAEQAGQWQRVVWYLLLLVLHRREEPELPEFVLERARQSRFREREEITRMGRSILEQAEERGRESMRPLVEQAEERGRESMRPLVEQAEERGEARGEARALRTVLTARFGSVPRAVEVALAEADVAQLTTWLQRAATAESLEEVGILPRE